MASPAYAPCRPLFVLTGISQAGQGWVGVQVSSVYWKGALSARRGPPHERRLIITDPDLEPHASDRPPATSPGGARHAVDVMDHRRVHRRGRYSCGGDTMGRDTVVGSALS